jgi:hypothetical protein
MDPEPDAAPAQVRIELPINGPLQGPVVIGRPLLVRFGPARRSAIFQSCSERRLRAGCGS